MLVKAIVTENALVENPFEKVITDEPERPVRKAQKKRSAPKIINRLVNIFSELGYSKGNATFNAFGTPAHLNVRIALNNEEKMFFYSTWELRYRYFEDYEIPQYWKDVLHRICDKYLDLSSSQFKKVQEKVRSYTVKTKNQDIVYCIRKRTNVSIHKYCLLCTNCKGFDKSGVICALDTKLQSMKCSHCGAENKIYDNKRAETVCTKCGTVC